MKAVLVDSQLSALLEAVTEVGNLLSSCGVCAVCGGPYINCWLDCVEFIHCRKVSVTFACATSNNLLVFPFPSPMCSSPLTCCFPFPLTSSSCCMQMFPLQRTCSELLPVSATICCYDCFNTSEHQYFGIAATVARSPCQ